MAIAKPVNKKRAAPKAAKKAANRPAPKKPILKGQRREARLDVDKLQRGEYVSCHQYMQVVKIKGNTIDLRTAGGKVIDIYKCILVSDAYSADHFEHTVTCNMTELSEILESAKDTIFKVEFKKKIDEKMIQERLLKLSAADLKKKDKVKQLAKDVMSGEVVSIVGHLANQERMMGRSLIIDLNAPASNNFRQVDHRTIQSIILRNVKYVLGNKSGLSAFKPPLNKDAKWNGSKLAVGDWLSECQYYQY